MQFFRLQKSLYFCAGKKRTHERSAKGLERVWKLKLRNWQETWTIFCLFTHLMACTVHAPRETIWRKTKKHEIQWNTHCIRLNDGPRDWQNVFVIKRFRYIEVLFHMFYYYWGKENRSLYRWLRLMYKGSGERFALKKWSARRRDGGGLIHYLNAWNRLTVL